MQWLANKWMLIPDKGVKIKALLKIEATAFRVSRANPL
jgi:hypothetical protein